MEEPLVSICCITYNHGKYITECLEGFLMQKATFKYEILIHDDASTDNTSEIIKDYAARYPDLIKSIFQIENQYSRGFGGRINATFNFPRAKGKYIAMCEGDDYWTDPLKLQKQVDFMEVNLDYNICFTYSEKVSDNGVRFDSPDTLKPIIHTPYNILVGKKFQTRTCTMVFRAELIPLVSHRKVNNGDTWLKIFATKNSKGITLPFVSAVYRVHSGGVWSTIGAEEQNRRSYFDWKQKFRYAIKSHRSACFLIAVKMSKSFIIWKLLKILKKG